MNQSNAAGWPLDRLTCIRITDECLRPAAVRLSAALQPFLGRALAVVADGEAPCFLLTVDSSRSGGYTIAVEGENPVIAGANAAQTMRGVYGFLRDVCGARMFTAGAVTYPAALPHIPADLSLSYTPPFEVTETDWFSPKHTDYALWNGLTGTVYRPLPAEAGGVAYVTPMAHTMAKTFCAADTYFSGHPEYFALRHGKRTAKQLCLSNPDVLRVVTDEVLALLREKHDPAAPLQILSLSQADNLGYCRCPACRKTDRRHGSHAGTVLAFVNAVARAVKEAGYDNVVVETLAYQYSRTPPRGIRPEKNVAVRLCTIECCFSHPLADPACKPNAAFAADLRGWAAICDRLYVWDYGANYGHFAGLFPNFWVLAPNMRFFAENGVKDKKLTPKSFVCAPLDIKGSGTERDPYRISLPEHLEQIASHVSNGETYNGKHFRLTRNFDYEGPQIGCPGCWFAGTFDGDDHTLTVTMNSGSHTALFYEIDGGTVKNLEIAGTVKGSNCVGAIAGYATLGSLIDNCHVTASVTGTEENVGGIVGIANNSTISNCRVDGKVTGGPNMVGGIVGWLHNSSRVFNCVVGTKVKITGTFLTVGGIAGYATEGDAIIANCASLGSVALGSGGDVNNSRFGGIVGCVGSIHSLSIYGCYSACTVGGTGNRGFIIGWIDAGSNVKTQEVYYTSCTGVTSTVGHGTQVAATAVTTKTDALKATAAALNKFVKTSPVAGATLTTWKVDGTTIIPKNYVNMLSLTASVFSEQSRSALIVIGAGVLAGIVAIVVLYRRKKKKALTLTDGEDLVARV